MVLSALLWQYIYLRLLCLYSLWIFIIFLQTSFIFIKSNSTCCKVYFHIKLLCCNFITKDLNNPENLCAASHLCRKSGENPLKYFHNFITFFGYLFIFFYIINVFNLGLVLILIHWSISLPGLTSIFLFFSLWISLSIRKEICQFFFQNRGGEG